MQTKRDGEMIEGHRLTPAQQSFLLSLPADGQWKPTAVELSRNRTMFGCNALRGFGQSGLVEGYYREETRHRLTEEGRAVVAALQSGADK